MKIDAVASELLATPERIACICADTLESELGVSVLYSDGTSYFRVVDSPKEQQQLWNKLIKKRPYHLIEFDDILFSPEQIARLDIMENKEGEIVVTISFLNHPRDNDMWYTEESYVDLVPAYECLVAQLCEHHNRRANIFVSDTHH